MSEERNETPQNLDIPAELEYSQDHVWVATDTEPAVLGITGYAAEQLGELVYVDLPEPGTRVEEGDEVFELESSKAVEPFIAPFSGTIRYVNKAVADDPSVVNADPYGEGWLLKMDFDEADDSTHELMDWEGYAKLLAKLR